MTRSVNDLMKHGLISTKAYNATLAKTRAQKSKMADFNEKTKLEGAAHNYGDPTYDEDHINNPSSQRASRSVVRKPGSSRRAGTTQRHGQPTTRHINTEQGPKFPSGGAYHSKATAGRNTRMKAKIPAQGGQYGGGGRNTQ